MKYLWNFCAVVFLMLPAVVLESCSGSGSIDREKLVRRHTPRLSGADRLSPFTVGNGDFAYTADITGLQTFPEYYENGIPLATQSNWGWHTIPGPKHYSLEDATEYLDSSGRQVPYASLQQTEAGAWLRANPHRLHLGRFGLWLQDSAGRELTIDDITEVDQAADLWEGILRSSFHADGKEVLVETACHPEMDLVGVRIRSRLSDNGQIGIRFDFPYGNPAWGKDPGDWNNPDRHSSRIVEEGPNGIIIERLLDDDRYYVSVQWAGNAVFSQSGTHSFHLSISEGNLFEFSVRFSRTDKTAEPLPVENILEASADHWRSFWKSGGAIDLSLSRDGRARELERRIVLSRYLTEVQCSGSLPPAETGLTFNSWYGKFHLEMLWWHSIHFALWGNEDVLEKRLSFYGSILPRARRTARWQGYDGVRWPKMVSSDGREGPSSIGVFLVWQQPHPIYLADLLYRIRKDPGVLEKYGQIVFETADFMASFAREEPETGRFILGPPLIPAQEIYRPGDTLNPAFELAYWRYGLKTAADWRERLDLPNEEKWDRVLGGLVHLPKKDGLYQNAENAMHTFEEPGQRRDHPSLLGVFGMLADDTIDAEDYRRTIARVMQSWDWQSTWGWDYPLIAMAAARAGQPETAIDALLMDVPKNRYLNNGHNYQDERLPVYLPGNGGLLAAVAMMAAGWEGSPPVEAPGFPKDGNWVVRHEGLHPLP